MAIVHNNVIILYQDQFTVNLRSDDRWVNSKT